MNAGCKWYIVYDTTTAMYWSAGKANQAPECGEALVGSEEDTQYS